MPPATHTHKPQSLCQILYCFHSNSINIKHPSSPIASDKSLHGQAFIYHVGQELRKMGFPGDTALKNQPAKAGDAGLIPGSGRCPEIGNGSLLQYSCMEKGQGQRSLAGYSPWGPKESDTTEHSRTEKKMSHCLQFPTTQLCCNFYPINL